MNLSVWLSSILSLCFFTDIQSALTPISFRSFSFDLLYPVYMKQNYIDRNLDHYLDRYPEDMPVYTAHPLFNIIKSITFLFIVQS